MFFKSVMSVVAAAAILVASSAQAQSLNGTWSVSTGTKAGKSVPSSALTSMSLMINGSSFEARSGGFVSKGGLGANTLASPPQMEFTINDGADKGRKVKAIYEMSGGSLKIAFSESDQYPSSMNGDALVLTYSLSGGASSSMAANGQQPAATTPPPEGKLPPMVPKRKNRRLGARAQ